MTLIGIENVQFLAFGKTHHHAITKPLFAADQLLNLLISLTPHGLANQSLLSVPTTRRYLENYDDGNQIIAKGIDSEM